MIRGTRSYFWAPTFCPTMEEPAAFTELEIRLQMELSLLTMPAMAETATP